MNLDDHLAELVRDVVRAELERAGALTAAPYPIGCSVEEAARLLGVGRDKVRELVQTGRIRRLDLGDLDRPGARVVIATRSLFELDTAGAPLAEVLDMDRRPA
jgi:excisionase family DNA binding protein